MLNATGDFIKEINKMFKYIYMLMLNNSKEVKSIELNMFKYIYMLMLNSNSSLVKEPVLWFKYIYMLMLNFKRISYILFIAV